jgi:thiamine kinase-like enzyme
VTFKADRYLLLERIDGTILKTLWGSLSPSQKEQIALTLQGYIDQLRQVSGNYIHRHVPGPMADTPTKCEGQSRLFGPWPIGPFQTSSALFDHFHRRKGQRLDDSQPLVLTHNDLNMRNIMVGHDGKLWIIDWEFSGFFPKCFEQFSMISSAMHDKPPQDWWECMPIITGDASNYEKELFGFQDSENRDC